MVRSDLKTHPTQASLETPTPNSPHPHLQVEVRLATRVKASLELSIKATENAEKVRAMRQQKALTLLRRPGRSRGSRGGGSWVILGFGDLEG